MSAFTHISLKPNLWICAFDAQGVRWREGVRNHITAVGRNILRDLLANRGQPPRYLGFGAGTTAVDDTDTALGDEGYRQEITNVLVGASKVSFVTYVASADATNMQTGSDGPVSEVGLFATGAYTSTPGGMLMARSIITPVEKTADVTLTIVWEIEVTAE